MKLLKMFRQRNAGSASAARERLQVIVAHQRAGRSGSPAYLQAMQQEILEVVRRYVEVGDEAIRIDVERDGELEVLEVNISVPDPVESLAS